MKYPQLVSTHAVIAISDWLISRLELLGVEAPQIYSRLLLSLLQSTIQTNEAFESNNFEKFFDNSRKRSKRYIPSDLDSLKKLNAVLCLREIVSPDHQETAIESLVDELLEKLKTIETQTAAHFQNNANNAPRVCQFQTTNTSRSRINWQNLHNIEKRQITIKNKIDFRSSEKVIFDDSRTDPKQKYFRAFPALSREMENASRISRQNWKPLEWPLDRSKTSQLSNSKADAIRLDEVQTKKSDQDLMSRVEISNIPSNSFRKIRKSSHIEISSKVKIKPVDIDNQKKDSKIFVTECKYNPTRRKNRRRRHQVTTETRTDSNLHNYSNTNSHCRLCPLNIDNDNMYSRKQQQFDHQSLPTDWDTDFVGCWEMGPDLIREFINEQNLKDNCYSSEQKACQNAEENTTECIPKTFCETEATQNFKLDEQNENDQTFGISFLSRSFDDEFFFQKNHVDDSCINIENMHIESSLSAPWSTRPLYRRETSSQANEVLFDLNESHEMSTVNQIDFEKLKAKFDSKIEALWNDTSSQHESTSTENRKTSNKAELPLKMPKNMKQVITNHPSSNNLFEIQNHRLDCVTSSKFACETNWNSFIDHNVQNPTPNFAEKDHPTLVRILDNSTKQVKGNFEFQSNQTNIYKKQTIWLNDSGSKVLDYDKKSNLEIFEIDHLNRNSDEHKIEFHNEKVTKPLLIYENKNGTYISKWSEGMNADHFDQEYSEQKGKQLTTKRSNKMYNICDNSFLEYIGNQKLISKDLSDTKSGCLSNWANPVQLSKSQLNHLADRRCHNLRNNCYIASTSNFPKNYSKTVNFSVISNNQSNAPHITLKNHSTTSSSFIDYKYVKPFVKPRKKDYPSKFVWNYLSQTQRATDFDDENLLISERTHFHPIKTYADGHTFDINSSLDVVDYKRSESGYFIHNSERYLKYMQDDNLINEEDATVDTIVQEPDTRLTSTNKAVPIAYRIPRQKIADDNNFLIKFQLRNCEVACQTDNNVMSVGLEEHSFNIKSPFEELMQKDVNNISGYTNSTNYRSKSCKSIETLNNNQSEMNRKSALLSVEAIDSEIKNYSKNLLQSGGIYSSNLKKTSNVEFSIWTSSLNSSHNNVFIDEFDLFQYSIAGKGLISPYLNNYISNNNKKLNGEHFLWSICSACDKEMHSWPANPLLCDELKLEADEILNDLKYMQDLYIDRSSTRTRKYTNDSKRRNSLKTFSNSHNEHLQTTFCPISNYHIQSKNLENGKMYVRQPEIINKVNRIIVNLLRPDLTVQTNYTKNNYNENVQTQFIGSLWLDGDEENIWSQSEIKPMNSALPFRQFEFDSNNIHGMKFHKREFLDWEHRNLETLWQKANKASRANGCVINDVSELQFEKSNTNILISSQDKQCPILPAIYPRLKKTLYKNTFMNSSNREKNFNRKRRHSTCLNIFYQKDDSNGNYNNISKNKYNNDNNNNNNDSNNNNNNNKNNNNNNNNMVINNNNNKNNSNSNNKNYNNNNYSGNNYNNNNNNFSKYNSDSKNFENGSENNKINENSDSCKSHNRNNNDKNDDNNNSYKNDNKNFQNNDIKDLMANPNDNNTHNNYDNYYGSVNNEHNNNYNNNRIYYKKDSKANDNHNSCQELENFKTYNINQCPNHYTVVEENSNQSRGSILKYIAKRKSNCKKQNLSYKCGRTTHDPATCKLDYQWRHSEQDLGLQHDNQINLSYMIGKNASILEHLAIMTRPLTR